MSILQLQTAPPIGLAAVTSSTLSTQSTLPSIIYALTNDTYATVTATGYLTNYKQDGFTFSNNQMALVYTTDNGPVWLKVVITYSGANILNTVVSLVQISSPGDVVLPTILNHMIVSTDTAGTLGNLTGTAINNGSVQAGLSGTAGALISYPGTPAKGSLQLVGVANTGNTVTTISNDAMGQASVINIVDPVNAVAQFLVGATATPFVSGNFPKASGTAGLMVDSGITAASVSALLAGTGSGGSVRSATVSSTGATASNVVTDPAISASSVVIARFVSSANVVTVQTVLPAAGQFTLVTDTAPSTCVIEYLSFTPSASLLSAGVVVGKGSYGGGSATFVINDVNITAGMVVTTNFQSQVTPSKVYTATCGAGTITFVCSANPGVCVIEYAAMLPGDISALGLHAANYSYAGGFASIVISDASITAASIVTAEFKSQSVVALIQKVTPSAGTLTILASIDPGPSVVAYIATAAAGGGSTLSNSLPSGDIIVGNASNIATPVAMSGAVLISNAGVTSLNPNYLTQTAVITMTAAQVNGAYAAPFLLIAAPGAGNGIVVLNAAIVTEVSTPFATGGAAIVQYANTVHGAGTAALSATIPAVNITAAASQVYSMTGYIATTVTATPLISGFGVYFSNDTAAFTVGTGSTVTIALSYMVMPLV